MTIPHAGNQPQLARCWAEQGLYAFNLLTLLLEVYGTEALAWEPVTIEMEIQDDFGVELSAASFDRLMTGIQLLTTNSFFVSTTDFIRMCVSLSGVFAPATHLVLPDCNDLAWGITEGLLIQPPQGDKPFNDEIVGYIGQCLDDEGILNPPDVLRIGTRDRRLIDRVSYDFSDDPEMFSGIQQMEQDKTADINKMVKARLHGLLRQLQALPLTTGKTAFVEQLLGKLPKSDETLPLLPS